MKSDRRHELQHNVLDTELAKGIAFYRKYKTQISWGALILLTAVLAVWFGVNRVQQGRIERQARFDSLVTGQRTGQVSPEQFVDGMKALSVEKDRPLAAMANLELGNFYTRRLMFVSAAEQVDLLDQATGNYRRVTTGYADQRVAVAKAHLGLARLAERQGDFAAAAGEYQTVKEMTDLADQPVAAQAQKGLTELDLLKSPVRLATTTSAPATTQPAAAKSTAIQPAAALNPAAPAKPATTQPAAAPASPAPKPSKN